MRISITTYLLLILCYVQLRGQQRIHVLPSASGNGDGTSWENAYTDLQPALGASGPEDEIWIAGGTYFPTKDNNRDATFTIQSGQKWYGGFRGTESSEEQRLISRFPTILSGNIGDTSLVTDNVYTVITAENPHYSTSLNGIDITGGYADGGDPNNPDDPQSSGGGMHISTSLPMMSVNMIFVDFIDNYAQGYGGAIASTSAIDSVTQFNINTCFFQNNRALKGGNAVYGEQLSSNQYSQIVDSQFRNNQPPDHSQELFFRFNGKTQGVWMQSNIAGNIRNGVGNGFVRVVIDAQLASLILLDNQLYSSELAYGYEIIQRQGDVDLVISGDNAEEISHGENTESAIVNIKNPDGHPLKIYYSDCDNNNNRTSHLIKIDQMDTIYCYNNIIYNNSLSSAAIDVKFVEGSLANFSNNIFSNNTGILYDLELTGTSSSTVGIIHSTFRNNSLPVSHPDFGPEELSLIMLQGNREQQLSVVNNIFYHQEIADIRTATLIGGNMEVSHNLLPLSDCNDNIQIIDGDLTCEDNLHQVNPFFLSDDPVNVRLAPCSPCIDAGENATISTFDNYWDFYFNNRIMNDITDIGASEFVDHRSDTLCIGKDGNIDFEIFGKPPFSYQWTNQDGESGEVLDLLLPGKYNLTITDDWGCTYQTDLVISPEDGLQFIHHDKNQNIQLCEEEDYVLEVPEYYDVIWPDGSSSSSFMINQPGTYDVQLSDGCISERISLSVKEIDLSIKDTSIILCDHDTLWVNDLPITSAGTYIDTIHASTGCDSLIVTYNVEEEEKGIVGFVGETMICTDEETLISIEGGQAYLWSNEGNDQQQWLTYGQYQVEVIDSNGCFHLLDIQIDTFAFSFNSLPSNISIAGTEETTFSLENNPGFSIAEVVPSEQVNWTVNSLTFLPSASGLYTVLLEDPAGCNKEWTIQILGMEKDINEMLMISNIITPNDDGINDVQVIYSSSEMHLDQLMIYDRWGGKVFTKRFTAVEPVYRGWDGKVDNKSVAPGIYIWVISYITEEVKKYQSGAITIMR